MTDQNDPKLESAITVVFAGAGSANVMGIHPTGPVTPYQLYVASKVLNQMADEAIAENLRVQREMSQMLMKGPLKK